MVNNNKINSFVNAVKSLVDDKEDSSNKVSSWNSTTNNIRFPTEKLVKDSLDGKADNNHTHELLLSSNDDSDIQLFNVSAQGYPHGEGQSLGAFLSEFWKKIYPVGSIYMSVNSTSPATLFGGTWEQIEDTFLLASGTSYSNGDTGGSATVTLTENQMPSHTHIQNSHNHTQNAHNHEPTSSRKYISVGDADWQYTGKRQMSSTTGSYYYPYSDKNTGGITEQTVNANTTATNNSQTATNQNTGGGQAHENMPPYLAVNVWKRTA